jgi:hypothetical protein
MAYPVKTPVAPAEKSAPITPDWVAVYYTPEAPANLPQAPGLDALEQMYAYYEA